MCDTLICIYTIINVLTPTRKYIIVVAPEMVTNENANTDIR